MRARLRQSRQRVVLYRDRKEGMVMIGAVDVQSSSGEGMIGSTKNERTNQSVLRI